MRFWLVLLWLLALPALAQPSVVFLGERHQSQTDHQAQLAALQELRGPVMIVAEMFTERSAAELETWNEGAGATEFGSDLWKREWGHPQELYLPLWSWARDSDAPVMWLRPDPDYTKVIRERGPAAAVPRIGEVLLGPASYRDFMAQMATQHGADGPVDEAVVDRYFSIQCFWDEFMAWRIAELASQHPQATLAVLVGDGHLREGEGIPWRLKRRAPQLQQSVRRAAGSD